MFVYVGSYTEAPLGSARGIEQFRFDAESGVLLPVQTITGVANPSFLTLDETRRVLYAVNELDEGRVSAHVLDHETSTWRLLNQQSSHGAAPCYISLDPSWQYAFVANYSGGTVAVLPIAEDGGLGPATHVVHHESAGVRPEQEAPHPHMIAPTPDGRLVLVTDLGIDQILVYKLDTESGQLVPNDEGTRVLTTDPGSGPRHFAFAPNGRYLYVINELGSTASVYAYDSQQKEFQVLQTLSTLPPDFTGKNSCAHIAVSPDGRFVYGSNRGHDSIVIWAVDDERGELTLVGHEATQGQTPRNFAIDPTGSWLLVANQDSDSIVPFQRDQRTGTLSLGVSITDTPSPVAIVFAQE